MQKLKLNIEGIEDDFFISTYLFGIVSSIKNYRFFWKVNAFTGYDLRLCAEIEVQLIKKYRIYFFPVYQYCQTDCELEHVVYHNQYEGEYLLPEFKHFDFLWLLRGNIINDEDALNLQSRLKCIDEIQLVAELTNEKIKNKGNLIF